MLLTLTLTVALTLPVGEGFHAQIYPRVGPRMGTEAFSR